MRRRARGCFEPAVEGAATAHRPVGERVDAEDGVKVRGGPR
jgi:hypothetical protein